MAKTKGQSRLKKAEAIVQDRVDEIDDSITELEKLIRPYDRIKGEIDKLRSARRALLGGSSSTGGGGSRIRRADVKEFLEKNPGSVPAAIAIGLGTNQPVVSSHLQRGKDELFIMKNKRWWVRDPKTGINTADDIEEE